MALEVTDTSFAKDVLEAGMPAMVDFWATWCGPCRMVAPTVEELAKEFDGQAVVAKVDVDNNQQIAAEYGIRNIPTILFFKDGQVVDKVVGVFPKALQPDGTQQKHTRHNDPHRCGVRAIAPDIHKDHVVFRVQVG